MKLDAKLLRYLSSDEFRVLTAVEMGSKNHEVVPTPLIANISKLKAGGAFKILGDLAKNNLVARVQNAKYDGYRLTYGGYDYLALHTFAARGTVYSVGNQIGVGKESDIYIVADEHGHQRVLKIHRLGRTSFRAIKTKRDYLESRKSASWMYMSRLAAAKEFAFMKALHEHGFPVPTPYDQNRHCVVMDLVDGVPLTHVAHVGDVGKLYAELMKLVLKIAAHGLVHGDFNEFNLLVRERDQAPILIDFPQMISTRHVNAKEQFDRDVQCVRDYFRRRYDFEADWWPEFDRDVNRTLDLDAAINASGAMKLTKKQLRELEVFLEQERDRRDEAGDQVEEEEDESDSEGDGEGELQADAILDGVKILSIDADSSTTGNSAHAPAESDAESDDDDSDLARDAPNNREFRAFRDQDLAAFNKRQAAGADGAASDGSDDEEPAPVKAPRLVKAKRTLTAEEIKERVARSVGKSAKGEQHRNSNKTRSRKDRTVKDSISAGRSDW